MLKNIDVSIIIVNWNGKHWLKDCLSSIYLQDYKNFEVILVDNGSTDGSVEYIKRLQDKKELDIMLVSRPAFDFTYHKVFWANWNYGLALSDREWTLLGYIDEIVYPDPKKCFQELMKEEAAWMIPREEIVSLKPFKSMGIEGPNVRFFPTGTVFYEAKPQSVHIERAIIKKEERDLKKFWAFLKKDTIKNHKKLLEKVRKCKTCPLRPYKTAAGKTIIRCPHYDEKRNDCIIPSIYSEIEFRVTDKVGFALGCNIYKQTLTAENGWDRGNSF